MFMRSALNNKRPITLFMTFFALMNVNAGANTCADVCFPEKIYTQCTANSRSLSVAEQAQCDKMTAACQSCNEEKKAPIIPAEESCKDVCNTEQLLLCHKSMDTLSIEEKGRCTKMTADCQTCSEQKKVQINKKHDQCESLCNTEQLIECHKNIETLSIEQKAVCSKLTSDCQTCTEKNKKTP